MDRKSSKRNYGIDALRGLSILFVILLHQLLKSGGLASEDPSIHTLYWTLEVIAYGAVNVFAIISGYVGYRDNDRPLKISGILAVWAQAVFYNFLITLSIHFIRPDLSSGSDVLRSLFPICSNSYWYLNAYLGLVALTPLLNIAIQHVSREKMEKVLLFILITFSLSVFTDAELNLADGYSVLWLAVLYIVGAAMKKFEFNKDIPTANIVGFGIIMPLLMSIAIATTPGVNYSLLNIFHFSTSQMVSYLAPTIFVASASAVLAFSRFTPPKFLGRIIRFCTPSVFAAYLINCQPLIFSHALDWQAPFLNSWSPTMLVITSLSFCVVFFIGAILIDKIRILIFRLMRIDKLLKRLDTKLANCI